DILDESPGISSTDYAVFTLSLFLSVGTGIYHAIRSRLLLKGPGVKTSQKDEYMMGGRKMPPIPVALSLLTTFLSGILMLGVPAEMFERGAQIWLNFVIGAVSSVLTALIFLPIFYRMKSTCLHEYFIYRFDSKIIREMFSALFLLFTISYMSTVIYAPSVALSPILRIDKWILILVFGLTTTLYTTIGGLKAVVWTDSLQALMMYGGVFALIYKGLSHPRVGGFWPVWNLAYDTGRISELWRMDPSPAQYNSLWINIFSGIVTWLASFGVNQLAVQRYCSLPSIDDANHIIYCTLLPFICLCSTVSFVGFIALKYFYYCNPLETGQLKDMDHLIIMFAKEVLSSTPGLFGLYVSCIMSATLSTLSSGMNSMAAAVYEDFLKHRIHGKITDAQATTINKSFVLFFGLLSTALAFTAEPLGGILRVCISVMGAMSGPFVGIFVLAMFWPRAGFMATFVSFIISNIAMIAICFMNYFEDPFRENFISTNSTLEGCNGLNVTIRQQPSYDAHFGNPNTTYIARLSTYAYSGIGMLIMLAIGVPITYFYCDLDPSRIMHLTYYGRHLPWPQDSCNDKSQIMDAISRTPDAEEFLPTKRSSD
uniref:Sodium/solute symporter n=1 Tax=Parascaris univalens TaxID=6257 RepID=A0A915B653_PARUN